ncbi:winged helix DNA-binding protein [Sphingobium aquiterrae]|uniref:winged helix DNA-binding protein n=1 Tax=Sphingobium aquiterrae TaxID=2038656 RepID=UPI0030197898
MSAVKGRTPSWPFIEAEAAPALQGGRRARAKVIERFCEIRQQVFDGLIRDAEFNLLIDAFLHDEADVRVTVGDACIAARVPQTTALRAIQTLIDSGLLIRNTDPRDNRRKLLSITDRGREMVARFIDIFDAMGGFEAKQG